MMAGFLGQWALRGYGVWACEKIDGALLSVQPAFSTRSIGRNRKSSIRSIDPFGARALRPKQRGAARNWLFKHFPLARAASFIRPDNLASKRVAERLGAVYERSSESGDTAFEYWVHHRPARI
jgi:hypothetical protein